MFTCLERVEISVLRGDWDEGLFNGREKSDSPFRRTL